MVFLVGFCVIEVSYYLFFIYIFKRIVFYIILDEYLELGFFLYESNGLF